MYNNFNHNEHAKQFARSDFWSQIRRTVNGEPIDDYQISLIISAVRNGLRVGRQDSVLDFGCGNGALSSVIALNGCRLHGVDNSEYLISIAKEYFEDQQRVTFQYTTIESFLAQLSVEHGFMFTKSLCYGAFSYFSDEEINHLFAAHNSKLQNVETIYIGNIPDISQKDKFFVRYTPPDLDLLSCKTSIGKWWTQCELHELARSYGWCSSIVKMPDDFYGSSYRFDLVLTRQAD